MLNVGTGTTDDSPLSGQRFRHVDSAGHGLQQDLSRASIDSESSDLGENEVQVLHDLFAILRCMCRTTACILGVWQILLHMPASTEVRVHCPVDESLQHEVKWTLTLCQHKVRDRRDARRTALQATCTANRARA